MTEHAYKAATTPRRAAMPTPAGASLPAAAALEGLAAAVAAAVLAAVAPVLRVLTVFTTTTEERMVATLVEETVSSECGREVMLVTRFVLVRTGT